MTQQQLPSQTVLESSQSPKAGISQWILQVFSYTFLSLIACGIVLYMDGKNHNMDMAKWILVCNAILIAIISIATLLYRSKDFWASWEGLFGKIPDSSIKKFPVLLMYIMGNVLPLLLVLWMGWHMGMPNALLLNIAAVPVVVLSLYLAIAPIKRIYNGANMIDANTSVLPAALVAYAMCIWASTYLSGKFKHVAPQ